MFLQVRDKCLSNRFWFLIWLKDSKSKAVSKELAPRNITVNTIAPGYIDTEMVEKIDEKTKHKLLNQIPLGRIGSPEDIAATVLYLASDEAGYVSGQTIAVDGGMTTT